MQSADLQDEHNHVENTAEAAVDEGAVAGAGPQRGRAQTVDGRRRRHPGRPHQHAAAGGHRLRAGRTTPAGPWGEHIENLT